MSTPLLPQSEVDSYGSALEPKFRGNTRTPTASAKLAPSASGAHELAAGSLSIAVRTLGVAASAPTQADGYLLYPSAAPGGGAVLARATTEGFEDFVVFEGAPKVEAQEYALTLKGSAAGLRLVDRTLEIVDAAGTPRLRMRPPMLVDEKGKATLASVSVVGCAFDASPAPPWGRPATAPGAATCTVRVAWNGLGVSYPAILDPSWTSTGSLSQGRGDHSGTLLANGRVLVVGGHSPVALGNEIYDPATGTWAATGASITRRLNHVAARLDDGKVLVAGGYRHSDWTLTATAERYDPTAGTWTSVASMSTPRENFAGVKLANGKVLVAGGWGGGSTFHTSAELFDPSAGTWASTGSMSTGRAAHRASLLTSGKVLLTGGVNSVFLATTEVYTPTSGTWAAGPAMATARAFHAQVSLPYDARAVVAGGHVDWTNTTASVQIYDQQTSTFLPASSLAAGRAKLGATYLGPELALAGGQTSYNVYTGATDLVDAYGPSTAATSPLSQARSNYPLVEIGGGKALAVGGYTATQYLASAEVFDRAVPGPSRSDFVEQGLPAALSLSWDVPDPKGAYGMATTFAATLKNNTPEQRRAYVDIVGYGLDGRSVTRSAYFDVTLAPSATQTLQVPISAWPIRSVGSESEVYLRAREYTAAGGPTGLAIPSMEYRYELDAGYSTATVHGIIGRDLDRTQPAPSTTQAAFFASTASMQTSLHTLTGQVWDSASGGFVAVSTPSTGPRAQYAIRGQWAKDAFALKDQFVMDYTPPQGAQGYKVCTRFRAQYLDSGYGEDFLLGDEHVPSYAFAFLTYVGGSTPEVPWVGYLDADGCTPTMQLGPGQLFDVWTMSHFKSGTSTATVEYGTFGEAPVRTDIGTLEQASAWVAPVNGGTYSIVFNTNDYATRVSSFIALAMRSPDSGLRPNQAYGAYANHGCPSFLDQDGGPVEACYDRGVGKLYVGQVAKEEALDGGDGSTAFVKLPEHNSQYKAVVGHEFGHFIGDKQWGLLDFGFLSGKLQPDTQEPLCRCDFVKSGNRSHCLQSREKQGFAINEAWGHFYAAKVLNDPAQSNCAFAYYKTTLVPNTTVGGYAPTPPPVSVSCTGPTKWLEIICPLSANRLGNEWDWLTFYYDIHVGTPSFNMAELQRVHAYACSLDSSGASLCNRTEGVFFNQADPGRLSLVGAATGLRSLGVLTQAQLNQFVSLGVAYGIDH